MDISIEGEFKFDHGTVKFTIDDVAIDDLLTLLKSLASYDVKAQS